MVYFYICAGVAVGVGLIVLFVWFNNSCLKITRYNLKIDGADRTRIVHLSDLHGKNFGRGNRKLIGKIARLKPDFIAFTGDIVHRYTPKNSETAEKTVAALTQIAPVYFVAGNHEMRNKGYRFLRRQLMEAGARVLDDEAAQQGGLTVVGLNGASLRNEKIFAVTPQKSPKMLLAHEPQYFGKYSSAGYDLILCGHAHGGQWRIPFTGIGLFAPGQGKFPKYTSGTHVSGKSVMIVSRGLGNSEFPLRLFNRPEIVVADINA